MAAKLKDFFDERVVRGISAELKRVHRFDADRFAAECLSGLDGLELTARAWRIADVMRRHLPGNFADAAGVLVASLGPELERSDAFGMEPFRYLPHVFYVAKHGLDDFEASMTAQYELTKRFSAEFSIRGFVVRHPEATMERLRAWAGDANVHVRRLVSEGTRPRLPWAPRLRAFQENPAPVVELLELLKDDPERYVQRSVANNVNDIGKDHPDRAAELCRKWLDDATQGRRWIVGHALRSLVKKGDGAALSVLGFGAKPKVAVTDVKLSPRKVRLGGELRFSFAIVSTAAREQRLAVDYAVHFVKAGGATRAKVFKLATCRLKPEERTTCSGSVSFRAMTTRKHYPGRHRIEARINGVAYKLAEFAVRP